MIIITTTTTTIAVRQSYVIKKSNDKAVVNSSNSHIHSFNLGKLYNYFLLTGINICMTEGICHHFYSHFSRLGGINCDGFKGKRLFGSASNHGLAHNGLSCSSSNSRRRICSTHDEEMKRRNRITNQLTIY